ncbi:MAG: response regulator [Clostridia bacterium]|nr:response regulator [Clostridia bacterium]
MKLKALIVDDEYPARQELRFMLEKYKKEIQIVGEAANSQEAWELIAALDYSILFLDINMPGISGLELAKKLNTHEAGKGKRQPYIVFVTAYEEFAVEAFGVNAVDYVLKPIDPNRFDRTLQKIFKLAEKAEISSKEGRGKGTETPEPAADLGLIPVEHLGKTLLLDQKSIIFINASDDYTFVRTAKNKYLTKFTLKELEKRLNGSIFHRCHRSYIVNIKQAREVIPEYNGTLTLVMNDEEKNQVPVSRSQTKRIRAILGL